MAPEKHEFRPDYAIPPGEILAEMLEVRGIKKAEFAERCGRPAKTISGILDGHVAITPETAIQFERVLGTAASLWTNLESRYRLRLAERCAFDADCPEGCSCEKPPWEPSGACW